MKSRIFSILLCIILAGVVFGVKDNNAKLDGKSFLQNETIEETESLILSGNNFKDYPENTGFKSVKRENYYCYGKLTDKQKVIYNEMVKCAERMSKETKTFDDVTEIDVSIAFSAILTDFPQFFWMGYNCMYITLGDKVGFSFKDTFVYCETVEERDELNKEINEKIKNIVEFSVKPSMSEYETELKLHDYICEKMIYNTHVAEKDKDNLTEEDNKNWNILGFFEHGKGVCESYSKIFQLLMYNVGIECTRVSGKTDESHMWNAVKIDGKWCYVDLTWDDGEIGTHKYNHSNMNMDDKILQLKHKMYSNKISQVSDKDIKKGKFNFFNEKTFNDNYYYVRQGLVVDASNFISVVTKNITMRNDVSGSCSNEFCLLNGKVTMDIIDKMIGDYDIFQNLDGFNTLSAYMLPSGNAFILEAKR